MVQQGTLLEEQKWQVRDSGMAHTQWIVRSSWKNLEANWLRRSNLSWYDTRSQKVAQDDRQESLVYNNIDFKKMAYHYPMNDKTELIFINN